ncbi:MAG: glycosyltransferase family 9 protein [Planctomycetota bacterium]
MRFLVIQTRDIGDVLLSTALCDALKAAHPEASVDMLTMDHCAGVVQGNPNIDEVVVLEGKRRNEARYMAAFLRAVRRKRYDVILNVQGQLIGLLTCLASRRSRRIGFDRFPWRLAHTDSIRLRAYTETSGQGYTLDDRFALIELLGAADQPREYHIHLDDAEVARGRALLAAAGMDCARPIVALGINARDDYKRWPLASYAELATWLVEAFGAQLFVFFGPSEAEYSRSFKPLLSERVRASVFDNVTTRSIRELAMAFRHCALYVGNDTGPRHIAQAVDLPAFAIVSPSSDKWCWIPWGHPRFRAVDTGDALGLAREDWQRTRAPLTPGSAEDQDWFRKLDAGFVRAEVARMITELGLFRPSDVRSAAQ